MNAEQVIKFRDQNKKEGKQIFIYLDNSLIFYDGLRDAEFLVWDDENELVYSYGMIRSYSSEVGLYRKAETPFEKYTFSYDEIQGMGTYMDTNGLRDELQELIKDGKLDVDKANEMLVKLAPIARSNVKPFERTMKTYSEKDYKEYQDSKKEDSDKE